MFQGGVYVRTIGHCVHVLYSSGHFFIAAKANGAQQDRYRQLALAINLDRNHIALAGFEFKPGAAWTNFAADSSRAPWCGLSFDFEIKNAR